MAPEFFTRIAESGVVAVAFVIVLRWMMTRFEVELKEIRKEQEKSASRMSRAVAAQALVIASMQKQLLSHDLTVTGINPSTGTEINERAQAALNKYEELQHVLVECQQALSELVKSDD